MISRQNDAVLNRRLGASNGRFSARHTALIRESWWLLAVAAVGFLTLILATYHKSDPGWSYSGASSVVQNKGGVVGAWLADLLLYLFGLSAWWWAFAGIVLVVIGYKRVLHPDATNERHHPWLALPDSSWFSFPAPRSKRCACIACRWRCPRRRAASSAMSSAMASRARSASMAPRSCFSRCS